jgi:hypothetical protein
MAVSQVPQDAGIRVGFHVIPELEVGVIQVLLHLGGQKGGQRRGDIVSFDQVGGIAAGRIAAADPESNGVASNHHLRAACREREKP